MSWDEPIQHEIGQEAYKYIHHQDNEYLQMKDKVYGVVFELGLIYTTNLLGLEEEREIFHFRHFAYFLLFAFACFVFFRLNLKLFKNVWIALIATLALVLCPRIFGHAFINPKDVPFLSMYIISFHAFHNYLLKPGYKTLLITAICIGLLINFRIMGVVLLGTVLFFITWLWIKEKKKKYFFHLLTFSFSAVLVTYTVWPYLWNDPLNNFAEAFSSMSKFPWDGEMLFNGKVIRAGKYPVADYFFTWITISVPLLYLFIGLAGMLSFLVRSAAKPRKVFDSPQKIMGWTFILSSVGPLMAVMVLQSTLYDDWRQLYFIYPGFIVFVGYAFFYLREWKPRLARIGMLVCFAYFILIGYRMYQLHPYEHVYFSEAISHQENYLQHHYDLDYWGTSFYEGLSYIAKTDPSDTIPIFVFHEPLRKNSMLLPLKDRKRFIFSKTMTVERAKYYLTTYRYDYPDLIGTANFGKIYYEVKRQNSVILKVWTHQE